MTARAETPARNTGSLETRRSGPLQGSNGLSESHADHRLAAAERIARLDRLALRNSGLPTLTDEAFDREKLSALAP